MESTNSFSHLQNGFQNRLELRLKSGISALSRLVRNHIRVLFRALKKKIRIGMNLEKNCLQLVSVGWQCWGTRRGEAALAEPRLWPIAPNLRSPSRSRSGLCISDKKNGWLYLLVSDELAPETKVRTDHRALGLHQVVRFAERATSATWMFLFRGRNH